MSLDEILELEARATGRPVTLVGSAEVAGVWFVIYDCEPYPVRDLGLFQQRRWAVVGGRSRECSRGSGTVTTEFTEIS